MNSPPSFSPKNLLEQHYVEKIAAASWRLRRLHRWQAQLFEDRALTEDERLDKLDKVLRHESRLHRQIDTAVRMLNRDVPDLHQSRARRRALLNTQKFEAECRADLEADLEVTVEARRLLQPLTAAPDLDTGPAGRRPDRPGRGRPHPRGKNDRTNPRPGSRPGRRPTGTSGRGSWRLWTTTSPKSSPTAAPSMCAKTPGGSCRAGTRWAAPKKAAKYASWDHDDFLKDQAAARALLATEFPPTGSG